MTALASTEARRPPRNAPAAAGTLKAWLSRRLTLFADLQVASTSRDVTAWLGRRSGALLEVGCGDQPYIDHVPARCSYTAIDRQEVDDAFGLAARPGVLTYSGESFPLGDSGFDALFHTEVLEHVFETSAFLAECRRVLRPSGEMFFTVPFQARYHYIPHDYFRFTPAALTRLLGEAGFGDIVVTPRGNDIAVAGYKVAAVGFRWAYGGLAAKALFLATAPVTIAALLIAHAASALALGSRDDCLGYSVTARAV